MSEKSKRVQEASPDYLAKAKHTDAPLRFSGGWEAKRLGDIAHIKTGDRNNEDKVADGQYAFFVRSENVERINAYSYDCEAVLVPGEGRIGDIFHYINGKFGVHQRVYAVTKFSPDVFGKFVYYKMVKCFGVWAMQNTVKATVDSLRLPTFQNFKVELPPTVGEQRAIADALSDVDDLVGALDTLIAKKRAIKQATMQQLLTGKTRLPGFSGEWETKRLGEIATIGMGRTPSRKNSAFWGRGHVWLSIADLQGKVIGDSKEEITDLAAAGMKLVPRGTLLMSFKLSIGRLCFAGCDLYTNEAICSFTELDADADYLYYALSRTDFSAYGKQAVKGYTLNSESLKLVEVWLPPKDEQTAIATVLSNMDAEIAALEQRRDKTRSIKQAMMQQLLTGRIRLVEPRRVEAAV